MRRAALVVVAVALTLSAGRAGAAPAAPALEGVWTATNAAKQVFRGFWAADVAVATPNVAVGTWSMTDERGKEVMRGTWSARQRPHAWRGAWSARIGGSDQVVSGTWEADTSTLKGAKTFRDMLARTASQQVAGVWHMGHAHGNWWLKAR
jgi:hypothetical protein